MINLKHTVMQTIKYTKAHKKDKRGSVKRVDDNIAHGLIELGVAQLYVKPVKKEVKKKKTKEMGPSRRKRKYVTK